MQFRLLGPLEVDGADGPIPVDRGKPRALLALLLLHPNEVVSTEFILEALWGDDFPDTAGHAVEVYISRLRRLLGPDRIERQPPGYRLRVLTGELDLERFAALTAEADAAVASDPARAAALLQDAERLWRGPPLQELVGTASGDAEINRLQEMHFNAIEARIDARLAAGSGSELVGELERLVAAQPFRERLRGQLMLALYRAGRQADALTAYHAARAALDDELGVEPGADLQALQVAILRQDPSLEPARKPGVAVGAGTAEAAAAGRAAAPRRTRRVALVGLLSVLVVVAVVIALPLLPGRATPPGASPSSSAALAASSPEWSPEEVLLLAAVPSALGDKCESDVERSSLAVAGLHCRPAVGSDADDAWYEAFGDVAGMNIAFAALVPPEGVEQGDCSANRTNVRGEWATSESTFSGGLLCFTKDGRSFVVWTYRGRAILARASRSGDDPDDVGALYAWWHELAVELR